MSLHSYEGFATLDQVVHPGVQARQHIQLRWNVTELYADVHDLLRGTGSADVGATVDRHGMRGMRSFRSESVDSEGPPQTQRVG